jgi:hypothetical protein
MSSIALLRKTDESERSAAVRGNEPFDLPRMERAVREILFAVGEDPVFEYRRQQIQELMR